MQVMPVLKLLRKSCVPTDQQKSTHLLYQEHELSLIFGLLTTPTFKAGRCRDFITALVNFHDMLAKFFKCYPSIFIFSSPLHGNRRFQSQPENLSYTSFTEIKIRRNSATAERSLPNRLIDFASTMSSLQAQKKDSKYF